MIYYAIRHIRTDELMPEVLTNGGYSHWNPDNPDMPLKIFTGCPRLFLSRRKAVKCIIQWFVNQNGRRSFMQHSYTGEYDDITEFKPDGRKKEDLEVVEVEVIVKRNNE